MQVGIKLSWLFLSGGCPCLFPAGAGIKAAAFAFFTHSERASEHEAMTPALISAVAVGGAIGATGRYLVTVLATRLFGHAFPWGTVIVNVLGSFAMGALITYMALKWSATQEARAFLAVGVLGGFTTFSSFSLDFATLYERKHALVAVLYAAGSVGLSLIAIFAGMALMRHLYG